MVLLPRGAEVERASDNIFADLDLPDANQLDLLSGLVIELLKIMRRQRLSVSDVARSLDLTDARTAALLNGDFAAITQNELMRALNRLGYDIELVIRPSARRMGTIRVS